MAKIKFFAPSNYMVFSTLADKLESTNDFSKADIIILPGGADISPWLYSDEVGESRGMDYGRDVREAQLVVEARVLNVPVFGICRGAQLLHALSGGTLVKHLKEHHTRDHPVVDARTKQVQFQVNSLHHQAIPPKEAIAMYGIENVLLSEDGFCTEAFVDYKRNVCGVQYHPEYTSCPKQGIEFAFNMIDNMV